MPTPDRPPLIDVATGRAAARGGTAPPPTPELQDEVYAVRGSESEGEVLTWASGRPEWKPSAAGSSAPYGLAIGVGGCNVPIGLHTKTNAQGLSDGVQTSQTGRTFHPLTDPQAAMVLPVFNNWYGTADVVGPNPITIAAAVERSDGVILPFTFGGQHTVTIAPGDYAVPDKPLYIGAQAAPTSLAATKNAGDYGDPKGVWIRTYVSVTAGQKWPLGIDARVTTGEAHNGSVAAAADLTTTGSGAVAGGAAGYQYGPCMVLGRPKARKPIVALVGDSQIEGANDAALTLGYAERALRTLGFPMVKVAKGGESASNVAAIAGRRIRFGVLEGCTHAIVNYGTNDLVSNTRTAAQLQTDLLAIWNALDALGIKVYQTTITPRTTSTDGWTSTANQKADGTAGSTDAARLATVNAYIRSKPALASGAKLSVLELSDLVSSAHDSGLWLPGTVSGSANERTNDGTHMSKPCIQNIVAPALVASLASWSA